nr:uncharacterized protein LOC117854007 [Setaria viridis]
MSSKLLVFLCMVLVSLAIILQGTCAARDLTHTMHDSGTGGFQASCNSASGCPYGSRTTRAAGRPEAAHGRDERIDHRARRVLVGWLPAQRDHQIRCHGTAPKLLVLPCHALHCMAGTARWRGRPKDGERAGGNLSSPPRATSHGSTHHTCGGGGWWMVKGLAATDGEVRERDWKRRGTGGWHTAAERDIFAKSSRTIPRTAG